MLNLKSNPLMPPRQVYMHIRNEYQERKREEINRNLSRRDLRSLSHLGLAISAALLLQYGLSLGKIQETTNIIRDKLAGLSYYDDFKYY